MIIINPYQRQCPQCHKPLNYATASALRKAIRRNRTCLSCAHTGNRSPNFGKHKVVPYAWLYRRLVRTAKKKNNAMELSFNDFLEFVKVKNCHYCNKPVEWSPYDNKKNGRYNLDRKNNSLGYTKENLVCCCKRCNELKSNTISYELMKAIGLLLQDYEQLQHMSNEDA